ncbi:MAG: ATP-binding protein [Gemmatimonadaceae bacterium]
MSGTYDVALAVFPVRGASAVLQAAAAADATRELVMTVAIAAVVVLGLVLFGAIFGRRIRAQLAASEARLMSEEHLRKAYEALAFGVVVQDRDGRITHANQPARDLLGLAAGQIGRRTPVPATVHWSAVDENGESQPPEAHPLAIARRTGRAVQGVVQGVRSANGGRRWLLMDAVPVLDPRTGALDEAIVSFVDITHRRQAQQELHDAALELEIANDGLRRANEQLLATTQDAEGARLAAEAANQSKSEFLATMSHELRTPLNAILGYTELLELNLAGPLTDRQRAYLERTRASGKHLLGLIDEVLDLAKVEAGQLVVARVEARVERALEAALSLVRPQAAARGLGLATPCEVAGVSYVGDEARVRQILVNLLSNAVKFTPPGGHITIRCGAVPQGGAGTHLHGDGPWVFVRVEDTGIGIPHDQLEAIFEPFVQVETGRTRTQGGTGLGLAIGRRLARLMGGDLTAESALGRGSAFTLWLPALIGSATPARASRPIGARPVEIDVSTVGAVLTAGIVREVVRTIADRLRADPETPCARDHQDQDVEDHIGTFLTEVGRELLVRAGADGAATDVPGDDPELTDGSEIRRLIAERHGAQRFRLGWSEAALYREYEIIRQEVETVIRQAAPPGTEGVVNRAIAILRESLDRAEGTSLDGFRSAHAVRTA